MQKRPLREARVAGHNGRVLQKLRAAVQKFGRQVLLQDRHIGEGDEHIAVLVKNGKIGGGRAAGSHAELGHIDAGRCAFLADDIGVEIGADGGDQPHICAETCEVVADIARNASGRGVHMAGIAVVHDDRFFGTAMNIEIGSAHAHDIGPRRRSSFHRLASLFSFKSSFEKHILAQTMARVKPIFKQNREHFVNL